MTMRDPRPVTSVTDLPQDVRASFAAALRSGRYRQYVGGWRSEDSPDCMCASAVLLDTVGLDPDAEDGGLTPTIPGWSSGMWQDVIGHLILLNDREEKSFAEIADIVSGAAE